MLSGSEFTKLITQEIILAKLSGIGPRPASQKIGPRLFWVLGLCSVGTALSPCIRAWALAHSSCKQNWPDRYLLITEKEEKCSFDKTLADP